jgi:hypothetical protein
MKKVILYVLLGVAFLMFMLLLSLLKLTSNAKSPEASTAQQQFDSTAKNWKASTYQAKEKYISQILQSNDLSEMEIAISNNIKNQFKYPEEADFKMGEYPFMKNASITDADNGVVFLYGFVVAKNSFGVKSKFKYQVRNIVLPDTIYIDKITVSEIR